MFAGSNRCGVRATVTLTLVHPAKLNDIDRQAWRRSRHRLGELLRGNADGSDRGVRARVFAASVSPETRRMACGALVDRKVRGRAGNAMPGKCPCSSFDRVSRKH
jgi:hypothetical protein